MKPNVTSAISRLAGQSYARYSAALHRYLARQPQNYLYGIAANVVREYLMRSDAEHRRMSYDSELVDREAEHPSELPPDEVADRIHVSRQLQQALSKLSPMHRAVVLCLKREGMSYEETARATGLTYWTVEKYYFQAKAQLKTMQWEP